MTTRRRGQSLARAAAAVIAAVAGTAAVFVALVVLAAQCGDGCVESPGGDTAWALTRGAWQWTGQFVLAVASLALTLLAAARALSRDQGAVVPGLAALCGWLTWWLAFERGLSIVV